jgi:anti-anti-sigma factor
MPPEEACADPLFEVRVDARGTTWTVVVTGELDLAVADRFDAAIGAAIAEAAETVVIDLSALDFVDSTGIHALLRAHREAGARDLRLVIIPASERVQRLFRICAVDSVLPFVPVAAPAPRFRSAGSR